MVEVEKMSHEKASRTSKEAHDQCLEIGTILYKMTQYLQQGIYQLRKIKGSVEATVGEIRRREENFGGKENKI